MKTTDEMTLDELANLTVLLNSVEQHIAISGKSNDELIEMASDYWAELKLDNPVATLIYELMERLEKAEKRIVDTDEFSEYQINRLQTYIGEAQERIEKLEKALKPLAFAQITGAINPDNSSHPYVVSEHAVSKALGMIYSSEEISRSPCVPREGRTWPRTPGHEESRRPHWMILNYEEEME